MNESLPIARHVRRFDEKERMHIQTNYLLVGFLGRLSFCKGFLRLPLAWGKPSLAFWGSLLRVSLGFSWLGVSFLAFCSGFLLLP